MARSTVGLLIGGMLFFGVCNSIFNKFQDMQCVADCDTGKPRLFEQPVWQTATMFVGEMMCLLALRILASRINPFNSAKKEEAAKGKYAKLTSDPLDSGIAIDDAELVAAAARAQHLKPHSAVPHGAHGATPNPVPSAVAEPYDEEDGAELLSGRKQFYFLLPAIFDICGTTLMNVGLLYTPVSIYQMTRSALVLFVGLFSVMYLGRKLSKSQVGALLTVTLGVFIVGLSGVFKEEKVVEASESAAVEPTKILLGISLILFAQIFTASQFVVEEKIMTRYAVEPLRAVGLEGVFGLASTLLIMGIAFMLVGRTAAGRGGYFDAPDGWHQIVSNPSVWGSSIAICISIGLFNFFGLAVTKSVSATARSTIDCCRTLGIWAVSLMLGWERFQGLQVVGFAVLVYGTFVFNGILSFPSFGRSQPEQDRRARAPTPSADSREDSSLLS